MGAEVNFSAPTLRIGVLMFFHVRCHLSHSEDPTRKRRIWLSTKNRGEIVVGKKVCLKESEEVWVVDLIDMPKLQGSAKRPFSGAFRDNRHNHYGE